ncbi:MAG: hypothetical protein QME79_12360 [Bacillota bacterium]|nr:hypothetical protein [Bacillota bacterium]
MIEKLWRALGGRKFLGLVIATWLCYIGRLPGEAWVLALGMYLGANVAQKVLAGRYGGGGGAG